MEHQPHVSTHASRYPYRAACKCGWAGARGYVAAHAAQMDADEHAKTHAA